MRPLSLLLTALLFPGLAAAGPTDPVVIERPDPAAGEMHAVGIRTLADLERPYLEEEFFASGAATVYTYEETPRPTVVLPIEDEVPYQTRLIVRRPAHPGHFEGTVVVEWWNSTASFDTAPAWDASAEFFGRAGWIYVGVTNSNTSIAFLKGGCRLGGVLPVADCRERYASLALPENGQAYDMMSQIAHLLKRGRAATDGAGSPIPESYRVERLFHVGVSQQGGSLVTYATAFHVPTNDGYFIQSFGLARPINFRPACGAGAPPYPVCTPRLRGADRRVRTDLPVPVVQVMNETDMELGFGVLANDLRQGDTEGFRYYETAGTSHVGVHEGVDVIPGFLTLEDACLNPLNTLADGPVFGAYLYNAMWENLADHVRRGVALPHGELLAVENGALARDAFGNAIGGIRLPELDVPVATYTPNNEVNTETVPPFLQGLLGLFCVLAGSVTPFDEATLAALYPSHGRYVSAYAQRVNELVQERFLLPADARTLKQAAARDGP